jgi:hypothetical protein
LFFMGKRAYLLIFHSRIPVENPDCKISRVAFFRWISTSKRDTIIP